MRAITAVQLINKLSVIVLKKEIGPFPDFKLQKKDQFWKVLPAES